MKKVKTLVLVALVIGIAVGIAFSQFVNKVFYHRVANVNLSTNDRLVMVTGNASAEGQAILVYNPTSVSGTTTLWDDTAPAAANGKVLNVIATIN